MLLKRVVMTIHAKDGKDLPAKRPTSSSSGFSPAPREGACLNRLAGSSASLEADGCPLGRIAADVDLCNASCSR